MWPSPSRPATEIDAILCHCCRVLPLFDGNWEMWIELRVRCKRERSLFSICFSYENAQALKNRPPIVWCVSGWCDTHLLQHIRSMKWDLDLLVCSRNEWDSSIYRFSQFSLLSCVLLFDTFPADWFWLSWASISFTPISSWWPSGCRPHMWLIWGCRYTVTNTKKFMFNFSLHIPQSQS